MTVHVDASNQVSCCYARRRLRWMEKVDVFVLLVFLSLKTIKMTMLLLRLTLCSKIPPDSPRHLSQLLSRKLTLGK